MAEQPSLTQGLTALLTPLATVGAGVYTTQTKSQINADRIKAGKQPCTGQIGQPADCPSIFNPSMPVGPDGTPVDAGQYTASQSSGASPILIVAILAAVGVVGWMVLSSKKAAPAPATPAAPAAKRKKSRKKR